MVLPGINIINFFLAINECTYSFVFRYIGANILTEMPKPTALSVTIGKVLLYRSLVRVIFCWADSFDDLKL